MIDYLTGWGSEPETLEWLDRKTFSKLHLTFPNLTFTLIPL